MGTGCCVLRGQVKVQPAVLSRDIGVLLCRAGVLWASDRALVCWAHSQRQKLSNSARGGDITGPGIYGNPSPCLAKLGFPVGAGLERRLPLQLSGALRGAVLGTETFGLWPCRVPPPGLEATGVRHSSTPPPAMGSLPRASAFRVCSVTTDLGRLENRVGPFWAGLNPQD